MIKLGDHRAWPRAHGWRGRIWGRRAPAGERSGRRISRAGWATILAVAIAALLWAVLIALVVYMAQHHPVGHRA